jgi:hypothetical protein
VSERVLHQSNRMLKYNIIYCLQPVVCHDLWHSGCQHNKYFKTKEHNSLHWFYLVTAKCFCPYFGRSSGSFIKYISHYWNILIWIHISVSRYNHHNTCDCYGVVNIFQTLKILSSQWRQILCYSVAYSKWCFVIRGSLLYCVFRSYSRLMLLVFRFYVCFRFSSWIGRCGWVFSL